MSAPHPGDGEAPPADGAAQLIADSAERLFAEQVQPDSRERTERGEFDHALWLQLVHSGLPLLLVPEAAGGFGQSWRTAFAVLRGIGFWQVPLPLAETMVAAMMAAQAGLPLPDLADGPLTLLELDPSPGLQLQAGGAGAIPSLSGTVHHVPWARHAQAAVLSLGGGRVALLSLRGQAGLTVLPQANLAGLPADTLQWRDVALPALGRLPWPLPQPAWTLGAVARAAMMVGALESALALALRHASERVQFGQPIGRYQAVQQNLALMAGDLAAARVAVLVAAQDAPAAAGDHCRATRFSAAVAKLRAGEAAARGAGMAHQVLGAMGFTQAHALQQSTRRLWAWREEFGTEADWALELGRAAIQGRAAGFWPAITQRHFGE